MNIYELYLYVYHEAFLETLLLIFVVIGWIFNDVTWHHSKKLQKEIQLGEIWVNAPRLNLPVGAHGFHVGLDYGQSHERDYCNYLQLYLE